jgi:hypothetical protein
MPVEQALKPSVGAYLAFYYADDTRFDLLERLGIDEIVAGPRAAPDQSLDAASRELDAQLRYSGPDGSLLALPNTSPRAFVVDGVETARGLDDALARYIDPAFPFRTTLLLDGADARGVAPRRASGPVDADVRVVPTTGDRRRIEVDSPRAGWLVLLDSWDKGWSAKVSGRETPLRRADFAYRAVQIPEGRSVVEMRYSTPGLNLGIAISVLGLLAALGLVGWSLRSRRRT